MARAAKPFKDRGKWRAQVTLDNGKRPTRDFAPGEFREACQWQAEQLANSNAQHAPELGGPTMATLAQAMRFYAGLYTVNKRGHASELMVRPYAKPAITSSIGTSNGFHNFDKALAWTCAPCQGREDPCHVGLGSSCA